MHLGSTFLSRLRLMLVRGYLVWLDFVRYYFTFRKIITFKVQFKNNKCVWPVAKVQRQVGQTWVLAHWPRSVLALNFVLKNRSIHDTAVRKSSSFADRRHTVQCVAN